jgi:alkylation response protein AidB-like acyl-CoA dehydrogenase
VALVLNEEQQLLRDSARSLLQKSYPVTTLRELRDEGKEWSPEIWKSMVEMGWTGILIPEAYGGLEFGCVGAGLIFEECGRTLSASPLLSSAIICASLVTALGNDTQKEEILSAIAAGETILSLALNEGPRFDPTGTALTAKADGGGYVLSGRKTNVADGALANKLIVVARTGGKPGETDGLSLFIVDRDVAGLKASETLNVDSRIISDFEFKDVKVDAGALLGEAGRAWPALERALDLGAVCSAAELLGIAQESFERTISYLKERKQFGMLIGSFQALQHRAAQLFCEIELVRSAVLAALQAIDADDPDRAVKVSMAKAKADKTAKLSVNEAVQMHGGIGMTDEFDIGFFMKRAAVARQAYGDAYYHADRFAKLRGY